MKNCGRRTFLFKQNLLSLSSKIISILHRLQTRRDGGTILQRVPCQCKHLRQRKLAQIQIRNSFVSLPYLPHICLPLRLLHRAPIPSILQTLNSLTSHTTRSLHSVTSVNFHRTPRLERTLCVPFHMDVDFATKAQFVYAAKLPRKISETDRLVPTISNHPGLKILGCSILLLAG